MSEANNSHAGRRHATLTVVSVAIPIRMSDCELWIYNKIGREKT